MKRWIYLIECDFCFDKNVADLYCVEIQGEPQSYNACLKCLVEKGWYEL